MLEGESAVGIIAIVLYAISFILALLSSVGMAALGPFQLHDAALAFLAAGLLACHVPGHVHHV